MSASGAAFTVARLYFASSGHGCEKYGLPRANWFIV